MLKLFKQAISPERFCQDFYDDKVTNNEITAAFLKDISTADTSVLLDRESLSREILALRLEMMSVAWMKCFLKPETVFIHSITLKRVVSDSVWDSLIQYNLSVGQGVVDLLSKTVFPQIINIQNQQKIIDSYKKIGTLINASEDVIEVTCNRLLTDVVQREDLSNLYAPVAYTFCLRINTDLGTLNKQAQIILMRFIHNLFESAVKEIKSSKIDFSLQEKARLDRDKWSDLSPQDFEDSYKELSPIYGYANRCFMYIISDQERIIDSLKKIEKKVPQEINKEAFIIELNKIRYSNACLSIIEKLEPKNDRDIENINLAIGASTKIIFGRERTYGSDEIDDLYRQWLLCIEEPEVQKPQHERIKFESIISKIASNLTLEKQHGTFYDTLVAFISETESKDSVKFPSCASEDVKYLLRLISPKDDFDDTEILKEISEDHGKDEGGDEYDVEKIDDADISLAYKFIDKGIDISDHLERFIGEKSSKLALKIIEADSEFGAFNVASNIHNFSKLDKNIALRLIEKDESYCVKDNVDIFVGLDQVVAERLIENDGTDDVLDNFGKFYIANENRLVLKILDYDQSLGAFSVTEAIDKFTNLNQKVAERLIENDGGDAVLENIDKFSITDESRLALKIIDNDPSLGAFTVTQFFDKFTNLNQKVAECLIENDEALSVIENLNKFTSIDMDQLILKIRKYDPDAIDSIVDNLDKFKLRSKQAMLEIMDQKVDDESSVEKQEKIEEPTLDELDWVSLPYRRSFSDDEYSKLKNGYIGKDMDSKWSLYFEEDGEYIMERSWTKTPVFKLHFSGTVADSAETKFPLKADGENEYYAQMIDEVLDAFFQGVWDE